MANPLSKTSKLPARGGMLVVYAGMLVFAPGVAFGQLPPLGPTGALGPSQTPFGFGVGQQDRWPKAGDGIAHIAVCWEALTASDTQNRKTVQDAVEATWAVTAAIDFGGWVACSPNNRGIRIAVADIGPNTKFLGRQVDGVTSGITLNFAFGSWVPDAWCLQSDANKKTCIQVIAVHEFGHSLGLAHEQNRYDTPGECKASPQGLMGDVYLTPWDKGSIMNYCNPMYRPLGWQLSALDKQSIVAMYGSRR